MKSGVWSLSCLMRSAVPLMVLCNVAAAGPATAPSDTQPGPEWVRSPLVYLPPNAESVTIPLKRAGNQLCAAVRIDGKDAGWFVIDTGSSITVIDESVAKRLGFETELGLEMSTPSRGVPSDLFRYRELQVGQTSMRHGVVQVANLTVVISHANFPFAGVLGCDFLRDLPAALDFRSATLTMYSREHFNPPGSPAFPLMFRSETPSVDASIEGHGIPLLIDTGSNSAFDVEPVFMNLYRLSVVGRHSQFVGVADGGGVGSVVESSFGPTRILGKDFQTIRAECPLKRAQGASANAGWIGDALLQDARLTFDYQMKTVWVDWQHRQSTNELLRELGDPKSTDLSGVTPLMRAAEFGRDDVVAELLKQGADVNAKSEGDLTALFYAASYQHPGVVKLLLAAGADPNITSAWGNLSALYLAAGNGDTESVKALLAAHAKVDIANTNGETALVIAAGADYPEVVGLLLEAGADITATTKDDRTALATAAALASPNVLDVLVKHGAKVNGVEGDAARPLLAAANNRNFENVKFLLAQGAAVDQRDASGKTALMGSAWEGDEPTLLYLLKAGADPSLRSAEGKTAADYTESPYVRAALMAAADAHASKNSH